MADAYASQKVGPGHRLRISGEISSMAGFGTPIRLKTDIQFIIFYVRYRTY